MARLGRSSLGRCWYRCLCGHRFRSTRVEGDLARPCPVCGLLNGVESIVGPLPSWGGYRMSEWERETGERLARSLASDTMRAALAKGSEALEGAAVAVPSFVPPSVEDDPSGAWARLKSRPAPIHTPSADGFLRDDHALGYWLAGLDVDAEGRIVQACKGRKLSAGESIPS